MAADGFPLNPAPATRGELDGARLARDPGESVFDSTWSQASEEGLGGLLWRSGRRLIEDVGQARPGLAPQGSMLTPEQANAQFGIDGALSFDRPIAARRAAELWAIKQRELATGDALTRSSSTQDLLGQARAFGSGLAASTLTDPVSLGLSFVPLGAPARLRAALPGLAALERSGSFGARVAGRAGFGAIEGALGAAALEPATFLLMRAEGRDYEFTDSLANLVLGAGLGAAGGVVFRSPVDALPVERRDEAIAAAIGGLADGAPVDLAPIVDDQRARDAAELAARPGGALAMRPIKAAEVFAPDGSREPATYAIVDIEDLVTSNDDVLMVNPDYPQALQPRDRTRAASETQVTKFGAPFQPERWGETFAGDAGAPVVGSDGVVESGNGRTIWLRRAYRAGDPRAQEMRAWLAAQGYPVEGVANPMLVRVVDAARPVDRRIAFATALNKPASAVLSVTEQAFADARRIDAALALHQGGEVGLAGNARFAREALAALTTEQERGALVDAEGALSKPGAQRLEAALMARAYGDEDVVASRFETRDEEVRTIGNALQDAAPALARVAAGVDAGVIDASLDLRPGLSAALALLRQAKQAGQSVRAFLNGLAEQPDMFGGGLTQRTLDALELLIDADGKVRAREKIAGGLDQFARLALESPAPVLFDEARIDPDVAYDAAARAQERPRGELGLRARDGGGAEGGGRGGDAGGPGADRGAGSAGAAPQDAARQSVEDELARQLALTERLTDDEARTSASVLASAYDSLARLFGMDAAQLMAERPVRIEGGGIEPGLFQMAPPPGLQRIGRGRSKDVFADPVDPTRVVVQMPRNAATETFLAFARDAHARGLPIARHLPNVGDLEASAQGVRYSAEKLTPHETRVRIGRENGAFFLTGLADDDPQRASLLATIDALDAYLRENLPAGRYYYDLSPQNFMQTPDGRLIINDPVEGGDARFLQSRAPDARARLDDALSIDVRPRIGGRTGRDAPDAPGLMDLDTGSQEYADAVARIAAKEQEVGTPGLTPEERAFIRRERLAQSFEQPQSKVFEQPAWHGSPHVFDRFTTEKIGAGEGNQAFGWGLYFTESRWIAEHYRKRLSGGVAFKFFDNVDRARRLSIQREAAVYLAAEGTRARAIKLAEKHLRDVRKNLRIGMASNASGAAEATLERIIKILKDRKEELPPASIVFRPGRLYEVELPDGPYLLWDRPLSEQPPEVQAAVAALRKEHRPFERIAKSEPTAATEPGEIWYRWLSQALGDGAYSVSDQAASQALRAQGVKGIKYLDGQSRDSGEGTYNFVVFDDADVIVRNFEQVAVGGDGARGSITFPERWDAGAAVIRLTEVADRSTFFHESGHLLLELMGDLAARADAPDALKQDYARVLAYLGARDRAGIGRDQHERFARALETYLMEGRAPTRALQRAFDAIKRWMLDIYRTLAALDAPLTDDVRGVFDRLIGGEEAQNGGPVRGDGGGELQRGGPGQPGAARSGAGGGGAPPAAGGDRRGPGAGGAPATAPADRSAAGGRGRSVGLERAFARSPELAELERAVLAAEADADRLTPAGDPAAPDAIVAEPGERLALRAEALRAAAFCLEMN